MSSSVSRFKKNIDKNISRKLKPSKIAGKFGYFGYVDENDESDLIDESQTVEKPELIDNSDPKRKPIDDAKKLELEPLLIEFGYSAEDIAKTKEAGYFGEIHDALNYLHHTAHLPQHTANRLAMPPLRHTLG
jgi:hypothetical protein